MIGTVLTIGGVAGFLPVDRFSNADLPKGAANARDSGQEFRAEIPEKPRI